MIRALVWFALLGPFFFLSYGFANSVTSQRPYVPSIVFGWERWVPFWSWTIVPYWTSDLLYAMSLLVCSTRRELDMHAKRLAAAQMIAISCFLAFPLRCVFERPETSGFFGWLFDVLMRFDKPFNQAPSLHVSLAVILWSRFSAHLDGFWLIAMRAWLLLIGLSTMTTYQHQFIDLPTGLLAGCLAIALFPDKKALGRRSQRMRLATFYLSASVMCAAIALKLAGAAWILLWPAAALLLVAVAYAADWPGAFQKRNGTMHPIILLIVAPYVALAWINSRWWTRGEAAAQEIVEDVWLGRAPAWFDRDSKDYRSIVDLTAELQVHARGAACRVIPMLDLVAPTGKQLREAVAAIEDFRLQRPTLVCCALGFSRSASAIAAWLVLTGRAASADEAIAMIRPRRPRIVVDDASRSAIDGLARLGASGARRF